MAEKTTDQERVMRALEGTLPTLSACGVYSCDHYKLYEDGGAFIPKISIGGRGHAEDLIYADYDVEYPEEDW